MVGRPPHFLIILFAILLRQGYSSPAKIFNNQHAPAVLVYKETLHSPGPSQSLDKECEYYFPMKSVECKKAFKHYLNARSHVDDNSYPLNTRVLRSVLNKRQKCTVSTDKLKTLKEVIKESLSKAPNLTISDNLCTLSFSDTNNCDKLLDMLQCGLNHLKNGLFEAFIKNSASSAQMAQLKNTIEEMSAEYQRVADDVRLSVSQEYENRIQAIRGELEALRSNIAKPEETLCIVEDCSDMHYRGTDIKVCRPLYCVRL